ncbi:MAG: hypothetical protein KAX20_05610, partial [Candidatus Omnitrophica bacterium]|nr:hypothetical protein [Candidatus Omnitrophota bacterium]
KKLQFNEFQGITKGEISRKFREDFTEEFKKDSLYPAKILKGKSPMRIFWATVSLDNLEVINSWIDNF